MFARGMLPSALAKSSPCGSWVRACHKDRVATKMEDSAVELLANYHQSTKHAFNRYARGPHGLDWANQPNPFRRYKGAPLVSLDHLPPATGDPAYSEVFVGDVEKKPLNRRTLSHILYDSLALSAWKTAGMSTWSLRVNPSSGNLHPTEGYVICGALKDVCNSAFVAHYAPKEHGLEIRAEIPEATWNELMRGFPEGSFLVGFSSIFWREAWKYGERAFRYCNHDVGHAIGAVAIAAATVGWKSVVLDAWSTQEVQLLLGISEQRNLAETGSSSGGVSKGKFSELEHEHGDCLMVLFPGDSKVGVSTKSRPSRKLLEHLSNIRWQGQENSLSREHVRWDIIYRAADGAMKPGSSDHLQTWPEAGQPQEDDGDSLYKDASVRQVVRTRRSAVRMDGRYAIQKEAFYQILLKSMPSLVNPGAQERLPFSALPWNAEVNAVLFVHRVVGISQGIYFLVRNPQHEEALRKLMRPDFEWQKPPGCPPGLPLYLLLAGECRTLAERISCHQDIASDGCFSLGMVTRFEDSLRENGAWMYPRLFWEAGLLGQLLYLEAHALGISATGIGCYFDDAVHKLLGFEGKKKFQSLYHFTIGVPVVDSRIMNLPAYPGPASPDAF